MSEPRYLFDPHAASNVEVGLNGANEHDKRDGDLKLYEAYRLRFESTKIPSERARFLTALGHFRNAGPMHRALAYALSPQLRPQEILTIPLNVAENDELKVLVWQWFKAGYGVIVRRIPPFYLTDLPGFARGCEARLSEEARDFFSSPQTDLPGTQEELAKVIERNTDCVGLRERQARAVATYLVRSIQAPGTAAPTPGP